jgi:hypothetical protein
MSFTDKVECPRELVGKAVFGAKHAIRLGDEEEFNVTISVPKGQNTQYLTVSVSGQVNDVRRACSKIKSRINKIQARNEEFRAKRNHWRQKQKQKQNNTMFQKAETPVEKVAPKVSAFGGLAHLEQFDEADDLGALAEQTRARKDKAKQDAERKAEENRIARLAKEKEDRRAKKRGIKLDVTEFFNDGVIKSMKKENWNQWQKRKAKRDRVEKHSEDAKRIQSDIIDLNDLHQHTEASDACAGLINDSINDWRFFSSHRDLILRACETSGREDYISDMLDQICDAHFGFDYYDREGKHVGRYTVEELVYDPSTDNYSHPLIGDNIRFKMTEIDENQFYGKVATEDHASFPENMFKWTIDEHRALCC